MERTSEQIRMDEKQDILYRIKTGLLMMRRLSILIIVFTFVAVDLNAQDDNEYKMEIGGGIGLVSYEGDFNGNITKDAQPMASILLVEIPFKPALRSQFILFHRYFVITDCLRSLYFLKIRNKKTNLQCLFPLKMACPERVVVVLVIDRNSTRLNSIHQ